MQYLPGALLTGLAAAALLSGCFRENPTYDNKDQDAAWLVVELGSLTPDGSGGSVAGCLAGTDDQTFSKGMVGCAGTVHFDKRDSLCAPGYRVCKASEWVDHRGDKKPTFHYWTDDELRYGGASYSCYVSTSQGKACNHGEPMRVCAGHQDPKGNVCNWINCGYKSYKPNHYFGGCLKNPTAGTLCCPK